jgi:hypothetical protein
VRSMRLAESLTVQYLTYILIAIASAGLKQLWLFGQADKRKAVLQIAEY